MSVIDWYIVHLDCMQIERFKDELLLTLVIP